MGSNRSFESSFKNRGRTEVSSLTPEKWGRLVLHLAQGVNKRGQIKVTSPLSSKPRFDTITKRFVGNFGSTPV